MYNFDDLPMWTKLSVIGTRLRKHDGQFAVPGGWSGVVLSLDTKWPTVEDLRELLTKFVNEYVPQDNTGAVLVVVHDDDYQTIRFGIEIKDNEIALLEPNELSRRFMEDFAFSPMDYMGFTRVQTATI